MKKNYKLVSAFCFVIFFGSSCSGTKIDETVKSRLPLASKKAFVKTHSEGQSRFRPVVGTKGMVVAAEKLAAEWGAEILRMGGNAIDAAVATGFALSVTRPTAGSLGGGGFLVFCPAPKNGVSQECEVVDYRESAPAKASRDMFLVDEKVVPKLSTYSGLASGVPGVAAGLLHALKKYGSFKRNFLLTRPIQLARQGFPFNGMLESAVLENWANLSEEARRILSCPEKQDGKSPAAWTPCQPGTLLKQPDLARVLTEISDKGRSGFYEGWVAKRLSDGLARHSGIISPKDLLEYKVIERKPVQKIYRGMEVVSMPPPSSGGIVVLQLLKFAELADQMGELRHGYGAAKTMHALAHGSALAFSDRVIHFGDPDFYNVPVNWLLSDNYLEKRWADTFKPNEISFAKPGKQLNEGPHTTHFAVVDKQGNSVSVTTSINLGYGSGIVPLGTGVFMNNTMDDFSISPGVANEYGLTGAEANSIAPGKRPLSSMSPTIVRDSAGESRIIIGARGGPLIISAVFQSLLNRLRFGMPLPDAVASPRFHFPFREKFLIERYGFSTDTLSQLHSMGYPFKKFAGVGWIHAIERLETGRVWGVPDHRSNGSAVRE